MDYVNCMEEFLEETEGRDILCAKIDCGDLSAELRVGYSKEEYAAFLKRINYEYDSGFGQQEVFGFIWYKGGTWSERAEYDGSEWWAYKSCPEIPAAMIDEGGKA